MLFQEFKWYELSEIWSNLLCNQVLMEDPTDKRK